MKIIAKNKSDYIRLVCRYKTKKDQVKTTFIKGSDEYINRMIIINRKLRTYRKAIKRIDDINSVLEGINKMVIYKYDISMYKSAINWKSNLKDRRFIRKMFCKYAIEQGISDRYISMYIGWEGKHAAEYRLSFTEKMQTDIHYLNQWHSFKKGMQRDFKKLKTA